MCLRASVTSVPVPVPVPGTSRCVVLVMKREDEQARQARQAPFKRQEPLIPVAKLGIRHSFVRYYSSQASSMVFSFYLGLCIRCCPDSEL